MKIFVPRDPPPVIRAKPEPLVQPFGHRVINVDQERQMAVSEPATPIAGCFDQLGTPTSSLTRRTHAEGIKVKLRCFRFGGDTVSGISRLLGGGTLERCVEV